MHDRTFERIGAASGFVFVLLAVLSGFIYPATAESRRLAHDDVGLGPRRTTRHCRPA